MPTPNDAKQFVVVPKDVEWDDMINTLGWDSLDFLESSGCVVNSFVFNHMKSHIHRCIQKWVDQYNLERQ